MNRRIGIVSMVALSSFLLCGMQSVPPASCNEHIGPSTGEVVGIAAAIGAVIVVGTVVLVKVHNSHHTIRGCVISGPDGLEVRNESDQKTYALTGAQTSVKVGDIVKINGTKEKTRKDSAGNEDFVVTKMSKDYGPCKAALASGAAPQQ
jgi:hypothetical protein